MREVSVVNAYLAFGSVIVMWGWHELAFLTGWITGPRQVAADAGAQGWQRFVQSVQVMLHHEAGLAGQLRVCCGWMQDGPTQPCGHLHLRVAVVHALVGQIESLFWCAAKRRAVPACASELLGKLLSHHA
jgi:putative photosynthetic complex assembly protein 2